MKKTQMLIILLLSTFFSCRPHSKEGYLKDFDSFIDKVSVERNMYDQKDWIKLDRRFEKYSIKWYDYFMNDYTLSDEITIASLRLKYNYFKSEAYIVNKFGSFKGENLNEIKDSIRYYKKNNMSEDLNSLIIKSKDLGDSATVILEKLIKEVDAEILKD